MKSFLFIAFFFFSFISFSQNNHIVKTDDGRRVLLKADFTWEYIDLEIPKKAEEEIVESKPSKSNACKLGKDFAEPKLNNKIQNQLKKGRATMVNIKKKVAKDYKCNVEDVILLSASETKMSGTYHFCANGTKVAYKRTGNSFAKKIEMF